MEQLFQNAKDVVIREGKATAALLQRELAIGYVKAVQLLERLEREGVISRDRRVLVG